MESKIAGEKTNLLKTSEIIGLRKLHLLAIDIITVDRPQNPNRV